MPKALVAMLAARCLVAGCGSDDDDDGLSAADTATTDTSTPDRSVTTSPSTTETSAPEPQVRTIQRTVTAGNVGGLLLLLGA